MQYKQLLLQYNDIETIVTRNISDFVDCFIEVIEPKELIQKLKNT